MGYTRVDAGTRFGIINEAITKLPTGAVATAHGSSSTHPGQVRTRTAWFPWSRLETDEDMHRSNQELRSAKWLRVVALLALSLAMSASSVAAQGMQRRSRRYAPGRIIVKLKQGQDTLARVAGASLGPQSKQMQRLGLALVQAREGSEQAVLEELRRDPQVEYAELDYIAFAQETPNDPLWNQQWALHRIGAPAAWSISHSHGTIVAVIDTGANLQHPELQSSLWRNPGEIAGNGKDDDGNGKVDDIHGWHFYHRPVGQFYEAAEDNVLHDDNGHGSHVAGIVAAQTSNAVGIAGVSWGARLMIVKVLDELGEGWYSDITQGIIYAADNGAKIINLSLGGVEFAQSLQDAVNYANNKGALVVAATGNDGGKVLYPAACDQVMAVAATGTMDQRMEWSNYGPQVDIAAPGESIVSTWRTGAEYRSMSGTSMATPHVSGAAALLWSWRPDYTRTQVQQRIESQADDVNAATHPGKDVYLGWGRLNLYRVLANLPPLSVDRPYRALLPAVRKQARP